MLAEQTDNEALEVCVGCEFGAVEGHHPSLGGRADDVIADAHRYAPAPFCADDISRSDKSSGGAK
jgi:hypothetical protein